MKITALNIAGKLHHYHVSTAIITNTLALLSAMKYKVISVQ